MKVRFIAVAALVGCSQFVSGQVADAEGALRAKIPILLTFKGGKSAEWHHSMQPRLRFLIGLPAVRIQYRLTELSMPTQISKKVKTRGTILLILATVL